MTVVPMTKPAAVPQDDAAINWQGWSGDDPPATTVSNTLTMVTALQMWADTVVREQTTPRLTIGIPSFDRAMRGVQPGELVGILARTASGKTHLSNHIADAILHQRPTSAVLLCNLEMPATQLVARLLRRHFKYTEDHLEQQIRMDALDVRRFTEKYTHLRFLDRGAVSLEHIEQEALTLQQELGPIPLDAIVVDHCGLVRTDRTTSAYERATTVAIGLKQLARRLNTTVLAVIQANRAANRPDSDDPVPLESARDSGAYEENCDFLIAMGPLVDGRAKGLPTYVKLRLAKNRRGPELPVTLVFDPISFRFHELEENRG